MNRPGRTLVAWTSAEQWRILGGVVLWFAGFLPGLMLISALFDDGRWSWWLPVAIAGCGAGGGIVTRTVRSHERRAATPAG